MEMTEEMMEEIDGILGKYIGKYKVDEAYLGEINPLCFNLAIPTEYDDSTVVKVCNEFFHELGVLPAGTDIKVGDEFDYCELSRNEEEGCFFAPFNHPLALKLKPSDPEYKYLLKCERAALEESDDGGEE